MEIRAVMAAATFAAVRLYHRPQCYGMAVLAICGAAGGGYGYASRGERVGSGICQAGCGGE